MGITTQSFDGNGSITEFTVIAPIPSKSHVRIDYTYDGSDHEIDSSQWDLLSQTVIFHTAPTDGYIVKISIGTDGYPLGSSDSVIVSDLTVSVEELSYLVPPEVELTGNNIEFGIPGGIPGANGVDGMTPVFEVVQEGYELVVNLIGYIPSTEVEEGEW